MLPVIANRNSQIRNIFIGIISVTSDGYNGVFSIFLNYRDKGGFAVVIDVCEFTDHVFRKGVEISQKSKIYRLRRHFVEHIDNKLTICGHHGPEKYPGAILEPEPGFILMRIFFDQRGLQFFLQQKVTRGYPQRRSGYQDMDRGFICNCPALMFMP